MTLIIISWVIFGIMAAFMLSYTKDLQHHQVLGVTLSDSHRETTEVQDIIKGYKRVCFLLFLLFIALSFLLFLPFARSYAEFFLLILVLVYFILHGWIVHIFQQKLQELKQEKGWIYRQNRIVRVDINVLKEKGKAGVSAAWVWLFFILSFLPTVYLLFSPAARELYPIGFSFIGPFCQLNIVFLYYRMLNSHTPALSDNTEINKACARTLERIRTTATTLIALSMLIFWLLFNLALCYREGFILIILPLIALLAALFFIAFWQQKRIRAAENYFFGSELQDESHLYEKEACYKWGFYYDPNDPRLMVPKRIASMGWTINIGHPAGKFLGLGIIVLVLAILIFVLYGGAKDYVIKDSGSQITIDAPMYDLSIEKSKIVSVSTLDDLPRSMRTNGYGGVNKSFGHFHVDGYGKCMLYMYAKGGGYVVLKLEGDNPGYVIVNGKTPQETEALYRSITEWVKIKE